MTATLNDPNRATDVTSGARLRFDVIDALAAKKLSIDPEEITDIVLAELFDLTRETIWRFRHGRMKPSLPTAMGMAHTLGVAVEDIAERTTARAA